MQRIRPVLDGVASPSRPAALIVILVLANLLFNFVANAAFRVSAFAESWRSFLVWQVIGNLAGFITVLTLTWLLRYLPLSIAFPLTTGLTVIGVQVVAAAAMFHEPIAGRQWAGTAAIVIGIFLVSRP